MPNNSLVRRKKSCAAQFKRCPCRSPVQVGTNKVIGHRCYWLHGLWPRKFRPTGQRRIGQEKACHTE